MRKIENWENVNEQSNDFAQLGIGPQICKIITVQDFADKEYLKIYFDIVGTDLKIGMKPETVAKIKSLYPEINDLVGEFTRQEDMFKQWPSVGITYRSYKDTAARFFKSFTTAVEKSNKNFVWDWDETKLVNKFVVVNFGEEEYEKDGDVLTSIKAREFRSIEALVAGDVKPLSIKKLTTTQAVTPAPSSVNNSDVW